MKLYSVYTPWKSWRYFAADIVYHKNCLSNYLRKFESEVEMIMNPPMDSAENVEITNIFQEFVRTINIKNHAHFL